MVFKEDYASVYDILYQDKDYEKECDFIEAVFKKYNYHPQTILELGCGTGGHALILAKRGYEVTGVDRSTHILEIARKKAKEEGLEVEFIQGDITNLSLGRKFDAVISMFAVMSYQTTNFAIASVCKLAKESLVPDGIFMFDCWYGPAVLVNKPTARIKEITLKDGKKIIRFTEPRIDILNHIVYVNFRVWKVESSFQFGQSEGVQLQEIFESHPMRFLFPQEIKYFLEVAGFKQVDFYPFLEINRELTENDWNMMVVGR